MLNLAEETQVPFTLPITFCENILTTEGMFDCQSPFLPANTKRLVVGRERLRGKEPSAIWSWMTVDGVPMVR